MARRQNVGCNVRQFGHVSSWNSFFVRLDGGGCQGSVHIQSFAGAIGLGVLATSVRAARANELGFPGKGQQLHSDLHGRRRVRLRSVARPQPPRARWRRDMRLSAAFCVLLAVAGGVDRGLAADPRYPDWPCVQAKVPEISLAAVWNGPTLDAAASKWKDNTKVSALVPHLSARRTPLDEAEKMIADFLSDSAVQKSERSEER